MRDVRGIFKEKVREEDCRGEKTRVEYAKEKEGGKESKVEREERREKEARGEIWTLKQEGGRWPGCGGSVRD